MPTRSAPPSQLPVGLPVEMATALDAVTSALTLLRHDPHAPALADAVRSGFVAVDGLDPSVTAVMLRRVLDSIEDCRGQGVPSSIRLGLRVRAARRALRLDPALEPTLPG